VSPAVIAALVVSVLSLIGIVVNLVWTSRLAERQAERNAQRDYVYEARKRVYQELQPLFFQLVDACESAYGRITNLATASRLGKLDSWLRDPYYLESTIYRLIAPAVIVRLCRRKLTFVDLNVEPLLRGQFALAKLIYSTWNDGHDIARILGVADYADRGEGPKGEQPEGEELTEHIVIGQLDRVAAALTTTGEDERQRCLEFGEFQDAYAEKASPVHKHAQVVATLLEGFQPDTRPILWRLLLCQAHLHRAFVQSMVNSKIVSPGEVISGPEEREQFLWRQGPPTDEDRGALSEALATAREHAQREFSRLPEVSRPN
jgi:hypothetical protein